MRVSRALDRWLLAAAILLCAVHVHAEDENSGVVIDNDSDLVLIGGRVRTTRPIPDNFAAAGGRIVIEHPVGGNAGVAGGAVEVRGPIGHKLGAAGGSVTIDSAVGGSVGAAGGEVRITRQASIGGSARIAGARMDIDGVVGGDLHAVGDNLVINGEVRGDVDAEVETITLGPGAKVGGKLSYVSSHEMKKDDTATVGGTITRSAAAQPPREAGTKTSAVAGIVASLFVALFVLGCGAIFIAVAPIFSVEAPDRLRASPWQAFGMGLLTVVVAPMLAVLFMITVVGIPVGIFIFALYPLALLLGFVVGVLWLSGLLTQVLKKPPPPTVAKAIGYFALALLALAIVGNIPVLGGLVAGVLLLLGVGAFEVELYRRMRSGSRGYRGVEVVRP